MATEQSIVSIKGPIAAPVGSDPLADIRLSVPFGARVGIVGPDAAANSALLRVLAGVDHDFAGETSRAEGLSVGLLPEQPEFDETKDVRNTILEGVADIKALLQRFDTINRELASPLHIDEVQELSAEQTRLYKRIDSIKAWRLDSRMIDASNGLRCPDGRAAVASLSHGDRRRVALCRLLMSSPDLLLLDDPTACLDVDSIAWLEGMLAVYPGTVVAATHDRTLLDNVADRIVEVADGGAILFEGGHTAWSEARSADPVAPDDAARRAHGRERRWAGASPAAHQAARHLQVADYARRVREAAGPPSPERTRIPPGPPLDAPAIGADGVTVGHGGRLLIDTLTFQLPAGAIMGVIGPEGAGKSTLLRLLAGQKDPDAGTLDHAGTAALGVLAPEAETVDAERTLRDHVAGGDETVAWNGHAVAMRDYLADFGFDADDADLPCGRLTAGQRYRAGLARVLRSGVNLLLLDEPDGDLDLDSRRILEAVLEDFVGAVVVVSNDRWLLDRVATHILDFAGDSQVTVFAGNYQDYRLDRRRRLGSAADRPHRLRYRQVETAEA